MSACINFWRQTFLGKSYIRLPVQTFGGRHFQENPIFVCLFKLLVADISRKILYLSACSNFWWQIYDKNSANCLPQKGQQKTAVARGLMSGLGGSRTRVQKPFQCPSTIIDGFFGPPEAVLFPADRENSQSRNAGSFIIRPQRQSLVCVVSCHHDAVTGKSRCSPGGMALSGQCYSIIVSVYF